MCGRFSLFVPPDVLMARFGAEASRPLEPRYNIAPGQNVAAIRNETPDGIDLLEWGLLPGWVDDPDDFPDLINARAETIAEKASFRDAFAERRCLVLADGFYEWKGERGSKQPYRIERVDDEPFAFAGLWETWTSNGDERRTTAIITTEPNGVVEPIHDRMPVMLEPEDVDPWLESDDGDELRSLLDPFPEDLTDVYPVSRRVNDPSNDSPDLVEPVDVGEQAGLGEFE